MLGLLFGFLLGAFSTFMYNVLYGDTTKAIASGTRSLGPTGSLAAASSVERSGSFLTDLIASIWVQVNEAVCSEIKNTVEPMFKDMLPGPLKTLHFTKLDLGSVPLRLDNCIVHECKTNVNGTKYVAMELDVVWDGQCDIELKADYIGALGVKHLKLAGRMAITMQPLVSVIPVVGAVQYAFVNPPVLELDFTGLANVADISTIKTTINKTIQDILAGMMVLPNRMLTKLDDVQGHYFQAYQPPLGIARISIVKGRGFQEEKRSMRKADIPDVYCNIKLGASDVWTTDVVKNSLNPVFGKNEQADVMLFDYDQILTLEAFDKDEGTMDSDDFLGSTKLTVGDILLSGKSKEVELQTDNRGNGAYILMHCDLLKLEPKSDAAAALATTVPSNPKVFSGVLTILLSQAFKIPTINESEPPVSYFVKIKYGEKIYFSPVVDGACPVFDCAFRIPLVASEELEPVVAFSLFKGAAAEDNETNVLVGTCEVDCQEVLNSTDCKLVGTQPVASEGPELEYQILFRSVEESSFEPSDLLQAVQDTTNVPDPHSTTSSPKGDMVKLTVSKGWGFQIEKRRLKRADIPDVYCNVQFGSSPTIWKTATAKNSVSPSWEESKEFRLLDHGQVISIEAFDEDAGAGDADDELGSARVSVGKVMLAGGTFDVELLHEGQPSGCFVRLVCSLVSESNTSPSPPPSVATESAIELTRTTASANPKPSSAPEVSASADTVPSNSTKVPTTVPLTEQELMNKVEVIDTPEVVGVSEMSSPSTPPEVLKAIVLTAVRGSGFEIEKRKFAKDDVPDVYCKISVGKDCKPWQTETVKNNLSPVWNASKCFNIDNDEDDLVCVEVYDEDKGISKDDLLGTASTTVRKLLDYGDEGIDLPLSLKGEPAGCTVTLRCSRDT